MLSSPLTKRAQAVHKNEDKERGLTWVTLWTRALPRRRRALVPRHDFPLCLSFVLVCPGDIWKTSHHLESVSQASFHMLVSYPGPRKRFCWKMFGIKGGRRGKTCKTLSTESLRLSIKVVRVTSSLSSSCSSNDAASSVHIRLDCDCCFRKRI